MGERIAGARRARYAVASAVAREGDEPEVVSEFLAARETMRRISGS
jgi:hypothetical protein